MVVAALIVWCPGFPSPATAQVSNNASSRKAKADLPPRLFPNRSPRLRLCWESSFKEARS